MFFTAFFAEIDSPNIQSFKAKMLAKGKEADTFSAQGYDAAYLLVEVTASLKKFERPTEYSLLVDVIRAIFLKPLLCTKYFVKLNAPSESCNVLMAV